MSAAQSLFRMLPCSQCNMRPRRFKFRGEYRADWGHDLCLQCVREIRDEQKAQFRWLREEAYGQTQLTA